MLLAAVLIVAGLVLLAYGLCNIALAVRSRRPLSAHHYTRRH